jgi:glutaminyl-peptide cyclotransferase
MRMAASLALFGVVACSTGTASSQPSPAPRATAGAPQASQSTAKFDTISGERAFEDLRAMVAIGPRSAGSPGIQQTREFLKKQLAAVGLTATEQSFIADTPAGKVGMTNLIVTLPGKRPDRIVIGSHYDTKPETGFVFVGANDGGSSTALLVELARVLKDKPREFTYELVFFDGEEAWGDWNSGNTFGSRHYVDAAKQAGTLSGVKAMILLDMIGERNVEIRQDLNSTSWLNDIFWRAAGKLGHQRTFVADTTAIEDDHMPFIKAGVPSIDLIDLDYTSWHTAADTLDKTDARSLKIVGDVVVAALPEVEKRLSSGAR